MLVPAGVLDALCGDQISLQCRSTGTIYCLVRQNDRTRCAYRHQRHFGLRVQRFKCGYSHTVSTLRPPVVVYQGNAPS